MSGCQFYKSASFLPDVTIEVFPELGDFPAEFFFFVTCCLAVGFLSSRILLLLDKSILYFV